MNIRNFLHECGTLRSPNCYSRNFGMSSLNEETKGDTAYKHASEVYNPLADLLAIPMNKNSHDGKTKLIWPTADTKPYKFVFKYNQGSLDLVEHELHNIAQNSSLASHLKLDKGKSKDGTRDVFTITYTEPEAVNPREITYKFVSSSGRSGSAGGNKGNNFESVLAKEIETYKDGKGSLASTYSSAIQDLYSTLKLNPSDIVNVSLDGGENKKRPLSIDGNKILIGGENKNIGEIVTDITLTDNKNKKHYLSLKYGKSCVLANIGLKRYLVEDEIKNNNIKSQGGKALLKMLGLNEAWFCEVFNAYAQKRKHNPDLNIVSGKWMELHQTPEGKRMFREFIESGIGFGYIWVHHIGNHTHIIDMRTKQDLENVIGNNIKAHIRYPNYTNKTITIKVELKAMIIDIVIRHNTGKVYPNVINFNYTLKH